ncbi:MAG: hypothetical protein ACRDHG_12585 [Anaerolineales bacterium]
MTQSPLISKRPLLIVACLVLATLACISTELSVVFDADGSGSGVVRMDLLFPADLSDQSGADMAEMIANLTAQGWEEVTQESADSSHYRITGVYHFGDKEGEKPLSGIMPEFSYTVEEAENQYKYFTFTGRADFSELDAFWTEAKSDWAVNGIKAEDTEFFFETGEIEIMSASEVQEMMQTYGEPKGVIRVTLPGQTPVDANVFWDNEQDYLDGKTDTVAFTWVPGQRAIAELKVVRRLEPLAPVSPEQTQANLQSLLGTFTGAIPSGSINLTGRLSGHINNSIVAFFNGGAYTCSDYQGRVLRWLDGIRTSSDPNVRGTLGGLDYGPIQTNGGGHRAVVVFPRGTDWRSTGTVLDPWPQQKPLSFPIASWGDGMWFVSGASQPAPDQDAGSLYPQLTQGTSSYPAAAVLQGDLGRGLARPTRVLMVRSPVTVMLNLPDGRRLGALADGTIVNDLPGEADMYAFPVPDRPGEVEWLFFLPELEVEVELTGSGAGDFHALMATANGAYGYGGQPIGSGELATFAVATSGLPSDLALPGGAVVPARLLPPEEIDAAMGITADDLAAAEQSSGAAGDGLESLLPAGSAGLPALLGILCLCVAGGTLGAGLIFLGLRSGRQRRSG